MTEIARGNGRNLKRGNLINFGKFLRTLSVISLLGTGATAQTTLSQITDTVNNPDGTPFTGTLSLTWTGTSYSSINGASPYSTSTRIYNGVLSVRVAPSTSASPAGFYLAVYTSSDGRTSWVETWQVGPSTSALTLSQVRSTANSTNSGSSSGGSTLAIGQVTGLSSYLNALSSSLNTVTSTVGGFNSTVGGLSNTVSNLQSTVNTLVTNTNSGSASASFIDGEAPSGIVNGSNSSFTLSNVPAPASSLMLTKNGILLQSNQDYTLSTSTINFVNSANPQTGDVLRASYRIGTTGQANFVDASTPLGIINGSNLVFALSSNPIGSSLKLFKNGFLLINTVDYTLTGSTITFSNATSTPSAGDSLLAYYRISN